MGQEVPSCAAPQSLKCSGHREFSLPAESSRIDIVISCGSQRPRPSASSARVNAWMEKLEPAAARGEPREAEELEVSATGNPYKGECGDQSSFRRLGIAKHTRYVSTYPLQCLESTKPVHNTLERARVSAEKKIGGSREPQVFRSALLHKFRTALSRQNSLGDFLVRLLAQTLTILLFSLLGSQISDGLVRP